MQNNNKHYLKKLNETKKLQIYGRNLFLLEVDILTCQKQLCF